MRALGISLLALIVPVAVMVSPGGAGEGHEVLLWLVALVPAFLLAYYRGWQGVTAALAAGMAVLAVAQATLSLVGRTVPDSTLLFFVVVAYIAISLGIGWLSGLLHRERSRAEQLALTDDLTSLPNRRHARMFLETEFAAAQRGRSVVVALFDLDRFKEYNDRHGHAAGDQALRTVAGVLRTLTRRMNLSARFGGEEFVSILSSSELDGALIFVEKVRSELERIRINGTALRVSVGMAEFEPGMHSPDDLLLAADRALYQAKQDGRDCIRIFGQPLQAAIA